MKNSDVKNGDTVRIKREFYLVLNNDEFRPNLIIEKGAIGIVKDRELFSNSNVIDENSDIVRLNIGFSSYEGIIFGIWVKAQDIQLIENI